MIFWTESDDKKAWKITQEAELKGEFISRDVMQSTDVIIEWSNHVPCLVSVNKRQNMFSIIIF